jgi:large subunit ribosomal protein L18
MRHKRLLNKFKRDGNLKLRLIVTKTNAHIYAQIVDDIQQKTLVYVSSLNLKLKGNKISAEKIGQKVAELAIVKGIKEVAFDRCGQKYHGQLKVLADAARKGGLQF